MSTTPKQSLWQEFRTSVRLAPRVWGIVAVILGMLLIPKIAGFVFLLALFAVMLVGVFYLPAAIGALLGRLVGVSIRECQLLFRALHKRWSCDA